MSFDLAVWFEPERISSANALEKYIRLCEADEHYAQVCFGTMAGLRPDQFVLEHRDHSADRHTSCTLRDQDVLLAALLGFISGNPAWKAGLGWQKATL